MPDSRHHPLALGKWLSYVRFLYIGLHRPSFRDEVLSELLPPLEADGSSVVWEAIGRHFTGMSYQEADRISQTNKEFIRALFPAEPIYLSLFPKKVQDVIGQVGPETKGVEKMLRRVGFEYAERIDPFDGGPHFVAKTDDIALIKETRRAKVVKVSGADDGRPFGLVSVERDRAPHFCATGSRFRLEGSDVGLPEKTLAALDLKPGDEVGVLPF
ncbi:MAG TPA: arginine N-succinyltransferase, partial [Polyangia bacterium]